MVRFLRPFAAAVRAGIHDYAAMLTWRSWLLGWFLRVVSQVIFFALIGVVIGVDAQTHYLLVGNAVLLAATTSSFAIGGATIDIRTGTFPLVLASPAPPLAVLTGRSMYVIGDALVSSLGALAVVGAIFSLPLPGPSAVLVVLPVLATAFAAYAFSIFVAGAVLRRITMRNLISNLSLVLMALLCGVNVPASYLPSPLQHVAQVLPVTHGLEAARGILAGNDGGEVAAAIAAELAVGALWAALAVLAFARFTYKVRRAGAAEFGY